MRTKRDRDERGYLEAEVIWEGALDEVRAFTFDGQPLDDDPRTLAVWFTDVKADARDAEADVQVYILEHGHPIGLADDEECTCAQYVLDGRPYWSHRGSPRETDEP